jgi:hypothetical protein
MIRIVRAARYCALGSLELQSGLTSCGFASTVSPLPVLAIGEAIPTGPMVLDDC